jgi:hypothetical protein
MRRLQYGAPIVRPTRLVAGAALTAALALGALPGIAGSAGPTPASAIDPAAFQSVQVPAIVAAENVAGSFDGTYRSAGRIDATTVLTEPGDPKPAARVSRPTVDLPGARSGSAQKPPRYKLSGYATFYGNGTTAMRLPRGTTIIVCGAGGCLERVVNDYGPTASTTTKRIIDLYTPDFFAVCGCPSYAGTTWVTVSVY